MALKIIVLGDVNGRLTEAFAKLASLHSKQSFAFAIVAGNLFADPATATDTETEDVQRLVDGAIEVPLPTYFTLGRRGLPASVVTKLKSNDDELSSNLSVLGRKARIKTSDGFRLVAVSGAHREDGADDPMSQYDASYSDKDAIVAKGYNDADLLITSDWPAEVRAGTTTEPSSQDGAGVPSIAELCTTLKPRYHFSASESYYEREPFVHAGGALLSVTRFISLAPFGNADKQKYMYAFTLEPAAKPPQSLPPGCTASPFTVPRKRKLESQDDSYNSFRFTNGNAHHERDSYRPKHRRAERGPRDAPETCYFCLSNPSCETHMIGSVGDNSYVTVAKGPLTTRSTFPWFNFPCHMLIIPLTHAPTLASIPGEDKDATEKEMQRYRSALHGMVAAKSRSADGRAQLGAVTFEVSRLGGVHDHWQFLPVPFELIENGSVEAAFHAQAKVFEPSKFAKSASDIATAEEGDYFKVMIWSEAQQLDMVLPIEPDSRFDLQFGRRVLAKLFGLERRTDWRNCPQTTVEETADANTFQKLFEEYAF